MKPGAMEIILNRIVEHEPQGVSLAECLEAVEEETPNAGPLSDDERRLIRGGVIQADERGDLIVQDGRVLPTARTFDLLGRRRPAMTYERDRDGAIRGWLEWEAEPAQ